MAASVSQPKCLFGREKIMTIIYFQYAAAALAFLAAIFWFLSAGVKLPEELNIGYGGVGGTVQELGEGLIQQSKFSKCAAISAGVASICEALFLAFSTCS